jgi:hypothetical protein
VAQVRGTTPPEIAVGVGADVFLLYADGTVAGGYPVATTSPVRNSGAPILGPVEGSPDVILGSRDAAGWAWDNFGQMVTGWPQEVADQIQLSPALGDLDQDGLTEIVLLSYNQLTVLDVNDPFDAYASQLWAMYGHDARRSGCADCAEDLVSAVAPPDGPPVPVRFAAPRPNPFNPRTTITFALERSGRVRLDVYNLRGERVRRLASGNFAAGPRQIVWDGTDDAGLDVASGTYTLILEAFGVQESRKVTLLK